jgi:hypothetical protein
MVEVFDIELIIVDQVRFQKGLSSGFFWIKFINFKT